MGDGDRSQELPQRVRGTTRGGPDQSNASVTPVLSEELRQRIQAAVQAERAQAAATDQQDAPKLPQPATVPELADSDVKRPAASADHGQRKRAAKPERPARPNHAAKAKHSAGPERLAESGRGAESQPVAAAEPVVRPEQTDQAAAPKPQVPTGPGHQRFGAVRWAALVIVFAIIGVLCVPAARFVAHSLTSGGATTAALQRQELQARTQAASWVAQQINQDDIVSCDRVMCALLSAAGFPGHDLQLLGPQSSYPVTSAVVVETPAVRSMFGSSLAAAFAPVTLAAFGSGTAEISVRVIAPHGAGAYQAALSADLAQRISSGSELANNTKLINLSPTARSQLIAGQVDSRLMTAIGTLAVQQPVHILRFENIAPGGSPAIPLRTAVLAENDQAADMSTSTYLKSMTAFVAAGYRPARTEIVSEGSQSVVRIDFPAPSPLDYFGGA